MRDRNFTLDWLRAAPRDRLRRGTALLGGVAVAMLLAGCGVDRTVSNAAREPSDVRDRHPIVLADKARTLDVFVGTNAATLDPRQRDDLRAFAKEFREHGKGAMTAFVPVGGTNPAGDVRGMEM